MLGSQTRKQKTSFQIMSIYAAKIKISIKKCIKYHNKFVFHPPPTPPPHRTNSPDSLYV